MEIRHSREREMRVLKETAPSMVFDPEKDALAEWQKKASEKLCELLCLPRAVCERAFAVEFTEKHEGFTEIRFVFRVKKGSSCPVISGFPKSLQRKSLPL